MKNHTITFTEKEFKSLINMIDDFSAMIGSSDASQTWREYVDKVDAALLKSGYKRKYN